jgi:hypothetical protein
VAARSDIDPAVFRHAGTLAMLPLLNALFAVALPGDVSDHATGRAESRDILSPGT